MGIIRNVKSWVKDTADQVVNSANNAVQQVSAPSLSLKQLEELEKRKLAYLGGPENCKGNEQNDLIQKNIAAVATEVYRTYLSKIHSLYQPCADQPRKRDTRVISFDITKWVTDSEEDNIEKLMNVYQVLYGEQCSIALIYTKSCTDCRVTIAIGQTRENADPSIVMEFGNRIKNSLRGNFPGSQFEKEKRGCLKLTKDNLTVAAVSNLASEKSEKFISQSMEKLLDGIVPATEQEEYSIILLATPTNDIASEKQRLQTIYTAISPYATIQQQSSNNESVSLMSNVNIGGGLNIGGGVNIGKENFGSITGNAGIGINLAKSHGTAETAGKSTAKTLTYVNYEVKHTMEVLEEQMKRLEQCQALGMWNFAAYVISPDYNTTQNVAHMYLSLTQGKESYLENSAVNVWSSRKDKQNVSPILEALSGLQHPMFQLREGCKEEKLLYPVMVDATVMVSGSELARALNFPRKSVVGLPVIQCAAFGRNVISTDGAVRGDLPIGCIYHMRKQERDTRVSLVRDGLTKHTFITGSTGSGKSNTVYKLLEEVSKDEKAHFLVIEPAKGEYKNVFGGRDDVAVYGTNPSKASYLLQINPFAFPEDVHVLEHIDRLVEVFNACWPMYAAMPAVLKESVERAYEECGWNLKLSRNPGEYPTFETLLRIIPQVVDDSEYSNDTSSDYKGALVTRVRSLTKGIHGMIFEGDTAPEKLFNTNAIIDLSRIGSQETKALIMGILVLKLQEFRMSESVEHNSGLRHITVLEEAHNLLRHTSGEQSQESANLQGKSVEMLANAIAEMRTYGEGFVIADQSPGLMDMSVIRNTNTKIILRLPDEGDRQLVGKAAGLNDAQIGELARLERGVAAIFQSDWLEPVLCKVDKFENAEPLARGSDVSQWVDKDAEAVRMVLNNALLDSKCELKSETVDTLRKWYRANSVSAKTKELFECVIEGRKLDDWQQLLLIYHVVGNRLKTAITKEDACAVAIRAMAGQYNIAADSELARRIIELMSLYYPSNDILENRRILDNTDGRVV